MLKVVKKGVGLGLEIVDMEGGLKPMQDAVGGYIERVDVRHDIDMWVNEEGLLIDLPLNLVTVYDGKIAHYIHGDVVFASHDSEGNTTSLNDEQIKWLDTNFAPVGLAKNERGISHIVHALLLL